VAASVASTVGMALTFVTDVLVINNNVLVVVLLVVVVSATSTVRVALFLVMSVFARCLSRFVTSALA